MGSLESLYIPLLLLFFCLQKSPKINLRNTSAGVYNLYDGKYHIPYSHDSRRNASIRRCRRGELAVQPYNQLRQFFSKLYCHVPLHSTRMYKVCHSGQNSGIHCTYRFNGTILIDIKLFFDWLELPFNRIFLRCGQQYFECSEAGYGSTGTMKIGVTKQKGWSTWGLGTEGVEEFMYKGLPAQVIITKSCLKMRELNPLQQE